MCNPQSSGSLETTRFTSPHPQSFISSKDTEKSRPSSSCTRNVASVNHHQFWGGLSNNSAAFKESMLLKGTLINSLVYKLGLCLIFVNLSMLSYMGLISIHSCSHEKTHTTFFSILYMTLFFLFMDFCFWFSVLIPFTINHTY